MQDLCPGGKIYMEAQALGLSTTKKYSFVRGNPVIDFILTVLIRYGGAFLMYNQKEDRMKIVKTTSTDNCPVCYKGNLRNVRIVFSKIYPMIHRLTYAD